MRLKLLLTLSVSCLIACSHPQDNKPQTAAQEQTNTPNATTFIEMNYGRVCSYNPANSFETSYYETAKTRKDATSAAIRVNSKTNGNTDASLPKVEANQTCQNHTQCPVGHACLPVDVIPNHNHTKRIVYACINMINRECTIDLDCPEYEKCFDGHCAMCMTDADCRYGNTCKDGACFPKGETVQCKKTTDCSYGEICMYGECSAFCNGNSCSKEKTCQGTVGFGVCLNTHQEQYSTWDSVSCLSNEDVELNYTCVQQTPRSTCKDDSQCTQNRHCIDGVCLECHQDSECNDGLHCIEHTCGCNSDSDCHGSSRCSDNHQCVACLSDSDCTEGYKCNEENKCAQCITSSECAKGMICGNPPGWDEFDTPVCLQCTSDEDCPQDTPFCSSKGECEPIVCIDANDCCYGEYCSHNQCKPRQKDFIELSHQGSYENLYKNKPLPKGYPVESNKTKKMRELGFFTSNPQYCTTHNDCPSGAWCSKSLHICRDAHKQKYLTQEFNHYFYGQTSLSDISYASDFCWRDNECPNGEVCSDFGVCGCNKNSCGEGFECSILFGCINRDESLCGNLKQIDNKCRCTEDTQCGEEEFCASNGTCESTKDPEALFLEGLRWSQNYHGRKLNREKSAEYLQKSAEYGNNEAKFIWAIQSINDDNTYEQGMTLLEELIQINYPEAFYQYALLINDDIIKMDTSTNETTVLEYLTKAADAGHTYAQGMLACLYSGQIKSLHFHDYTELNTNLIHIQPDIAKAKHYYKMFFTYSPDKVRNEEMDAMLKKLPFQLTDNE